MLYLRSAVEVGGIYVEAAQECYKDAMNWAGGLLTRLDERLANAINGPEDEL